MFDADRLIITTGPLDGVELPAELIHEEHGAPIRITIEFDAPTGKLVVVRRVLLIPTASFGRGGIEYKYISRDWQPGQEFPKGPPWWTQ